MKRTLSAVVLAAALPFAAFAQAPATSGSDTSTTAAPATKSESKTESKSTTQADGSMKTEKKHASFRALSAPRSGSPGRRPRAGSSSLASPDSPVERLVTDGEKRRARHPSALAHLHPFAAEAPGLLDPDPLGHRPVGAEHPPPGKLGPDPGHHLADEPRPPRKACEHRDPRVAQHPSTGNGAHHASDGSMELVSGEQHTGPHTRGAPRSAVRGRPSPKRKGRPEQTGRPVDDSEERRAL